ncbi:MAG: DNA polymerase III subunit beta [Candidatus Manganitrophus sp. SA1]|nr:DNA polymerase III subunit beta [Candidatus Manganitrophus morganii]MCG3114350.1 DNA polymerase III subunit beta [Candidatus Manganitrophus morganii]
MKIKIERKELLTGIQRVQGVVEKRNTMPILSHILMEAQREKIALFATDLEIGIQGAYPAEILEPGRLTFSARKLFEIIREFPEGKVEITGEANNWVTIQSGKSHFRIVGLPPEEFPTPPASDAESKLPIDAAALSDLIRRTLYASGENDARYILNGVLVQLQEAGGKKKLIRFVATDGHRLSLAEAPITIDAGSLPEQNIIVPKKAILEIKKALDEGGDDGAPELAIGKNQLVFRRGAFVLTSRLMEGNYPNYRQVIPTGNDKKVSVSRGGLEGGLRRVSLLAREKTNAVKFTLESGRILLNSNNPEMGEANEEVAASFAGEGFSTGFNARYLLDALSVLEGEEATLEFKDSLSPCLIKEEGKGFLAVVMPMRV